MRLRQCFRGTAPKILSSDSSPVDGKTTEIHQELEDVERVPERELNLARGIDLVDSPLYISFDVSRFGWRHVRFFQRLQNELKGQDGTSLGDRPYEGAVEFVSSFSGVCAIIRMSTVEFAGADDRQAGLSVDYALGHCPNVTKTSGASEGSSSVGQRISIRNRVGCFGLA